MTDMDKWIADGEDFGWEMPYAAWWKRLPIVRNIRTAYLTMKVQRHNSFYQSVGMLPTGYDGWVLFGIANGMERAKP